MAQKPLLNFPESLNQCQSINEAQKLNRHIINSKSSIIICHFYLNIKIINELMNILRNRCTVRHLFDKICLSRGNQTHFYMKTFPPNPFPSFIISCLFKHRKSIQQVFLSQIGHLNILISYAFYMQVYIPDENIL